MAKRNRERGKRSGADSDADARQPSTSLSGPAPESPRAVVRTETTVHVGPLPDPDTLRQYDHVAPGAAQRIIAMGEREQRHRHRLDMLEAVYGFTGMLAGLVIGLTGIAGAVYLGINGQGLWGTLLGGGTLGSLVGAFIYGRRIAPPPGERRH